MPAKPKRHGGTAKPWWRRYQGRWQDEEAALNSAGWAWRRRRSAPLERSLRVDYPSDRTSSSPVRLNVVFPATYPFFPPRVYDRDRALKLNAHRDPITGELCLLHDADWNLSWTVVDLLNRQLPILHDGTASRGSGGASTTSLDASTMAEREPLTAYARLAGRPAVLVDG